MNLEKFTERARGFLQSAQTIATREDHGQLTAQHLLKAMLDDPEGQAARVIVKAGGDLRYIIAQNDQAIQKLAKVSGQSQIYTDQKLGKVLVKASDLAAKHGDSYVSSETLLEALLDVSSDASKALKDGKLDAKALRATIEELQNGRGVHSASAESNYEALKKFARDLTQAARDGKIDPIIGRDDEIRRSMQVLSRRTKTIPCSSVSLELVKPRSPKGSLCGL